MPIQRSPIQRLPFLLLVAFAASCGKASPLPPAQPGSFIVGVVQIRSAGDLVQLEPIARFTGTEWANTWPEPAEDDVPVPELSNVPTSWLGKPVPRDWTLPFIEGGTTTAIALRTLREKGGCSSPVVLQLSKTPDQMRRDGHLLGLAVDTN